MPYGAEGAVSGAGITQDQESGGAFTETLPAVRTAGGITDSVQTKLLKQCPYL
jgi:hypothetical protein